MATDNHSLSLENSGAEKHLEVGQAHWGVSYKLCCSQLCAFGQVNL